jgi:hypothetical protein
MPLSDFTIISKLGDFINYNFLYFKVKEHIVVFIRLKEYRIVPFML